MLFGRACRASHWRAADAASAHRARLREDRTRRRGFTFPSRFQLLAAAIPCPCGFWAIARGAVAARRRWSSLSVCCAVLWPTVST
ncbi:MAG: ATP-binding protein [Collinsella sp.]